MVSTVGTSTTSDATWLPFQRKTFYANGRFWVFYNDGTNMVYCTSTDGSTWSSAITVRAATHGSQFSVWFDGTYLHYAYAYASKIYYRRGTPNSDGSITWSAVEQTVATTYNYAVAPMVSVDSNGYVWIGYKEYDTSYNYYPWVIKSGNNDGTWGTTPFGFPYKLSTTTVNGWMVSVVPLTSGKMLAVYAYDSATVKAKKWDGSAWGSEVATTSAIYHGHYHSAVAQGDDVHLVFLKDTGYDILYVKYTYSSNSFGTETTLQAGATTTSAPVLSIDTATNDLYVFAATKTTGTPSGWTANHIYYVKYTASTGTWGSWTDWIDETTEVLYAADRLTCFYKDYGSKIDLVYMTKTASPYNVKFAYLSITTQQTYTKTFTSDGQLLKRQTKTATTDARLLKRLTKTLTADALLKLIKQKQFTTDSHLLKRQIKTFTADAKLLKQLTKTFLADAIVALHRTKQFTADGKLLKRQAKTFSVDAFLEYLIEKGFTADGLLLKRQTKQFTSDAKLLKRAVKTFSADALLEAIGIKGIDTDALLLKRMSKTFTADAYLMEAQLKGFAVDGLLLKRITATFTADAILQSAILTKKTFKTDAILLKRQTATFTVNAYLTPAPYVAPPPPISMAARRYENPCLLITADGHLLLNINMKKPQYILLD